MTKPRLTIAAVAASALSVLALAACGGSSSASVDPATAPAVSAPGTTAPGEDAPVTAGPASSGVKHEASTGASRVGVSLGGSSEFALTATPAKIAAGKVTFRVRNDGSITHELVVVRTDMAAGALASGGGRADETGSAGESGDLTAGASANLSLNLPAGHYVLLCNLPGHYAGGMRTDFTVG